MPTLRDDCYLKILEGPVLYDAAADELYELDETSLSRFAVFAAGGVDGEAEALLAGEGLLQDAGRRTPVRLPGEAPAPSLRYLEIQVTGRCDKACRHCYLGPSMPEDMSPSLLARILHEFGAMQGLKVMVSGGEPRCHPDLPGILGALEGTPFRRVLLTHGEGIDAPEAARLGRFFHQVQVSLDGCADGHDALRGAGSFKRAVAGIEALRAEGVAVAVATMAHSRNLPEFPRLAELLPAMGVSEWSIDVPCHAGRWSGGEDGDPGLLRALGETLRYAFGGGYHGGSGGLACGSHLMTVFPDGTAAKCGFFRDRPLGDVRGGLDAAWARLEHVPLGRLDCRCDQVQECAGGCRYRAQVLTGSPLAADPVQCYFRGVE